MTRGGALPVGLERMPEARHLQVRVDLGRHEGPVRDAAETALSMFG